MHTPDWRAVARASCAASPRRVVIDYPALAAPRRSSRWPAAWRTPLGARVEAVPRLRRRAPSRATLARRTASGVARRCTASSCCRSRFHKRSIGRAVRHGADRGRAARPRCGCCGLVRHRPVTLVAERLRVLVTGATGFTGGHLARALAAPRPRRPRAGPARRDDPAGRHRTIRAGGIELVAGDLRDPASLAARRRAASTSSTTSPRSTGRRAFATSDYRAVNATAVRTVIEAAARGRRAPRRALQHRRRPRRRRASAGQRRRAAQARRHLPGDEARRGAGRARRRRRDRRRGRDRAADAASTVPAIAGCSSCSAASRGAGSSSSATAGSTTT